MNIESIGDRCSGCGVCSINCPCKCILMKKNNEGFLYPVIDSKQCVDCGICMKKCPVNVDFTINEEHSVYAAKCRDEEIYKNSASGGIATIISSEIIKQKGIVYGCTMDEKFNTLHVRVDRLESLYKLQGSKYTQSKIVDVLPKIHVDLLSGKKVLFIGTPCQVAAVLNNEKGRPNNLYLIDLICHGVINDDVLKRYLQYRSKKLPGEIVAYKFRDKTLNERERLESIKIKKENAEKKYYNKVIDSPLYYGFLNNMISRKSCYGCKFKSNFRLGDITLGDYWQAYAEFDQIENDNGYSKVVVNTDKGNEMLQVMKNLEIYQSFKKFDLKYKFQEVPIQRSIFFEEFCDVKRADCKSIWNILKPKYYLIKKAYSKLPFQWRKYLHRIGRKI